MFLSERLALMRDELSFPTPPATPGENGSNGHAENGSNGHEEKGSKGLKRSGSAPAGSEVCFLLEPWSHSPSYRWSHFPPHHWRHFSLGGLFASITCSRP